MIDRIEQPIKVAASMVVTMNAVAIMLVLFGGLVALGAGLLSGDLSVTSLWSAK